MTGRGVVLVDWANVAWGAKSQTDVEAALERILEAAERHVVEDRPDVDEIEIRLYSGWDHEEPAFHNYDLALVEAALGSGAFEGRFAGRRYRQTIARSLILGGPALRGTLRNVRPAVCRGCTKQITVILCGSCQASRPIQRLEQKMVDTAIVADAVAAITLAEWLALFSNDKDLTPGLVAAKSLGLSNVSWIRHHMLTPGTRIVDPAILTHIKVKADTALWI